MRLGKHVGPCRAKKGLLFLRDCEAPASALCTRCGRTICHEHTVKLAAGPLCPECAAQMDDGQRAATSPVVMRAARRRRSYAYHGYLPYYYGHHRYYSDSDFRTFDGQEVSEYDAEQVAPMGPDDYDEDFMES